VLVHAQIIFEAIPHWARTAASISHTKLNGEICYL